jgi:hypothetical protein
MVVKLVDQKVVQWAAYLGGNSVARWAGQWAGNLALSSAVLTVALRADMTAGLTAGQMVDMKEDLWARNNTSNSPQAQKLVMDN